MGVAHQRRVAIHGVDELAVRKGNEQSGHKAQVNDQQAPHGCGLPRGQQDQTAQTGQKQQDQEADIHAPDALCGRSRVAAPLEPQQPGGADQKPQPADRAQHDRQAGIRVGRLPGKNVVVDGGRTGRQKIEPKPVKGEVMQPSSALRKTRVGVIAAVTAAAQIGQPQGVPAAPGQGREVGQLTPAAADGAPKPRQADAQGQHNQAAQDQGRHHHQPVGNHLVKRARAGVRREDDRGVLPAQHQRHDEAEAGQADQAERQSVASKQPGQDVRPGKVPIAFQPQGRQGLGHVDPEFVRRRVLAGVVAAPTVVAQIG